jgi:hypothetical protein
VFCAPSPVGAGKGLRGLGDEGDPQRRLQREAVEAHEGVAQPRFEWQPGQGNVGLEPLPRPKPDVRVGVAARGEGELLDDCGVEERFLGNLRESVDEPVPDSVPGSIAGEHLPLPTRQRAPAVEQFPDRVGTLRHRCAP